MDKTLRFDRWYQFLSIPLVVDDRRVCSMLLVAFYPCLCVATKVCEEMKMRTETLDVRDIRPQQSSPGARSARQIQQKCEQP